MMLCVWLEIEGKPGHWYCPNCGVPRGGPNGQRKPSPRPEKLRRECLPPGGVPAAPPTATERLRNWATATEEWIAAGRPERSADEQRLIADVCRGCDQYRPEPLLPIVMGGGQCQACGCGLQPERRLGNALLYATYRCRLGRWNHLIVEGQISYVRPTRPAHRDTADEDGSAAG